MSSAILAPFKKYQNARVEFVNKIAELATRPQNIEGLQNAGVMSLLRPLLLDNVPKIQQSAALAIGRLASYSDELAESILVVSLSEQNRFYKKSAAFVLRAVAKHSSELAQAVVDSGALDALVICLEEFDPSVKEAACYTIAQIAKHDYNLATSVAEAGAIGLLVLCIQEPEVTLKRIAASALGEICKHNKELGKLVVDAGAVPFLAGLITHSDSLLKRHVCNCLAQVSKHSPDLSEVVVDAHIFPNILLCLKDIDPLVRQNAATCIREITKTSADLSQKIAKAGGESALIGYIADTKGSARLPGIMTLGYIAAYGESLALTIITANALPPLLDALVNEPQDHIKAAAAWTLDKLGGHGTEHAKYMADADVPSYLLAVYKVSNNSPDLKKKTFDALKNILFVCNQLQQIEHLVTDEETPIEILQLILGQFAKSLNQDQLSKKSFASNGKLGVIQRILSTLPKDHKLIQIISEILSMFTKDIRDYYRPDFVKELLGGLDDFNAGN